MKLKKPEMKSIVTTSNLCRKNHHTVANRASYITGQEIYDTCSQKIICNRRNDVVWHSIILPAKAPTDYHDLQKLCEAMELAEKRCDARVARQYIIRLPNELPLSNQRIMVIAFIRKNFTSRKLCSIAAIHAGINPTEPHHNNPHAHILVSTRSVSEDGFALKKDRLLDSQSFLMRLQRQWVDLINHQYEKNHMPYRISLNFRDDHERVPEKAREHAFTIER